MPHPRHQRNRHMAEQQTISITGEPITDAKCRFTVDRPVYPEKAFHFANAERAKGSPLGELIFAVPGVNTVQVSHNQITVTKHGSAEWPVIGRQIGDAIRAFVASGELAVSDELRQSIPSTDEIRAKVEAVLQSEINPSVAQHGGQIRLIEVKENVVFIQMGGGCQGCGQADVTLKYGIEVAIRDAVPEVGDILDVTDHASGRNPYYTPSKK